MDLSYPVAFLGGLISLLTPCSVLVIPIFATALVQKKSSPFSVLMAFSLGLTISLLPLAIGAIALSQVFRQYQSTTSFIVGTIFVILGFGYLLGKQLPLPDVTARFQHHRSTTQFGAMLMLGIFAGLGSTACIGPILGAIITLGAASTSPFYALSLMSAYALGLVIPLLLLTYLFIKRDQTRLMAFRKKNLNIAGNQVSVSSFASGILLLIVAYVFLFHHGSAAKLPIVNNSQFLDMVFDLQDFLLVR